MSDEEWQHNALVVFLERWNQFTMAAHVEVQRKRLDALETRCKDIADESFGPFPVQTADGALSCVEQGIFDHRKESERVRRQRDEARELIATLVYWHDQGSGRIDESWWQAARDTSSGIAPTGHVPRPPAPEDAKESS